MSQAAGARVEAAPGGGFVLAPLERTSRAFTARVELPQRADGAVRIQDRSSRMVATFRLEGARSVAAAIDGTIVRYPSGGPGETTVVHHLRANGTEDYVEFPARPTSEEVRYRVDVSQAAGVRLVENVLELVDGEGTPRLRMAAPYVDDHGGTRHAASVTLEDCAADHDPGGPWGRPVTPPGKAICTVRIAWGGPGAVLYPAVLDPAWTSATNTMSARRRGHTATLLTSGKVLVVGGDNPGVSTTNYLGSADLFDPTTNTFAATAALKAPRTHHVAVRLADGNVLVGGGEDATGVLGSSEIYDVGTPGFTTVGPLVQPRKDAAIVLLGTKPLVAGGLDGTATVLKSTERFDPTTNTWVDAGDMPYRRVGHYLTGIATGQAMAIAGTTAGGVTDLPTCDVYPPGGGGWTSTGTMATGRSYFGGTTFRTGNVLVAGGASQLLGGCTNSAEFFDTNTGAWTSAGSITTARARHTLTALSNGGAVLAGGVVLDSSQAITSYLKSTELYSPISNSWFPLPDLETARFSHTATALSDDRILLAGGDGATGPTDTAEIFSLDADGTACTDATPCKSGFCVDGVCCESACTSTCYACVKASTGVADGACAPVSAGKDPRDVCTDDGAPGCGQNGLCDGAGACQRYPSPSCTPRACTSGTECTSGTCEDGICCDRSCSGTCEACTAAKKGSGQDGVCGFVVAGNDPDTECGTMGTGSCAGDATCDGQGSCQVPKAGQSCAPASCTDSVTLSAAAQCTALGECTPVTTSCDPYRCDATTVSCKSTCTSDADCAPKAHCTGSVCQKAPNGAACTSATECSSGSCADGVCCDQSCTGQCEACNVAGYEGTCRAVTGTPVGGRPPCTGTGTCAGTCNGQLRSDCDYPSVTAVCGSGQTTCTDGVEQGQRCNGLGACLSGSSVPCDPYVCNGDACGTTCTKDADCITGYKCDANGDCVNASGPSCGAEEQLVMPDGSKQNCRPFKCDSGACKTTCETNADCMSGARCLTLTHKCAITSDDGGCGCRTAGGARSPSSLASGVGLLTAAVLVRRRTRRRRSRTDGSRASEGGESR